MNLVGGSLVFAVFAVVIAFVAQHAGLLSFLPLSTRDDPESIFSSARRTALSKGPSTERMGTAEWGWWATEPLPVAGDRAELTFVDVTGEGEAIEGQLDKWPPETVACVLKESFDRPFHRFRVQANKRHAHPFKPVLGFEVVLPESSSAPTTRIPMSDAAKYTCAQILERIGSSTTISYVRLSSASDATEHSQGALSLAPWERALPPWFPSEAPEHWIAPTPPPAASATRAYNFDFADALMLALWRAVPTLSLGVAHPSARTPALIASSVYLLVHHDQWVDPNALGLKGEYVAGSEQLVPGSITEEQVRTLLLGRTIETAPVPALSAEEILALTDEQKAAREQAEYMFGVAWGYEPATQRLYVVTPAHDEFVVDLSAPLADAAAPAHANTHASVVRCAWVGPVSTMLDGDARYAAGREPTPYSTWCDDVDQQSKELNAIAGPSTFEVGEDGAFVGGDVVRTRIDDGDWDVTITGAMPGRWTLQRVDTDGNGIIGAPARVRTVLHHADTPAESGEADRWEEVDGWGVDSGYWALFSRAAFSALLADAAARDIEAEEVFDHLADLESDEGLGPRMPQGVLVHGNDGSYHVQGVKQDGKWARLRVVEDNSRPPKSWLKLRFPKKAGAK